MKVKRCLACGVWKPRDGLFWRKSKKTKDGLSTVCKKCQKEKDKTYRDSIILSPSEESRKKENKRLQRHRDELTDSYIKIRLSAHRGYRPSEITPRMIMEKRRELIEKRLLSKGTVLNITPNEAEEIWDKYRQKWRTHVQSNKSVHLEEV